MRCPDLHSGPLLLAALLLSGCPPSEPGPEQPESVTLARYDGWVRVTDPSEDLFADQRPSSAVCDDAGYLFDPLTQTLEVQTELCDYLTVAQPTLVELAPGDEVHVFAYHDLLTAPEPAQGYMALALGDQIEWEYNVAIPGDPGVVEAQFTIDRALPAGTPMQFHVHNHGPNTWELAAVLASVGG
ncbi:MAG: hypothetical protein R6X02_14770 [Enhygromyxa sp.]